MELKLAKYFVSAHCKELLIEPYGIETLQLQHEHHGPVGLLIEPYGIETYYAYVPGWFAEIF